MGNNVAILPIVATPLSDGFTKFGINQDAAIGIQAMEGHSAFVSGVACSYSLPPAGNQNAGALVLGRFYTITNFVAGDNFLNVGAGSNANGVVFQATASAPTNWTNGSVLSWTGNISIYSQLPSGGSVDINKLNISIDLTQDGPFVLLFDRAALLRSEEVLYFLLAAGGPGCVGNLNLLGVGGSLNFP